MKIVLLHGPAKLASRTKLLEIKKKFDPNNVVIFDEGSSTQDIKNNLTASSLFSEDRLVILENPQEDFLEYKLPTTNCQLVFWFDKDVVKKSFLESIKMSGGQILYFEESKELSVFPFLDFLAEGNKKAFLEMEKLKSAKQDIHYLITMVFYLLRSLVATPKNAPNFVRAKLQKQRMKFDEKKLRGLYRDLLILDYKLKSGLIELPQAEFSLVKKFID